jgi:hypothetical protein
MITSHLKNGDMGYSKCSKAWRVLMPNGVMRESRDVVFPADKFIVGTAKALQ